MFGRGVHMLELLYGKNSVYRKIKEAMIRGVTDQILIVPQHYSHEAERMLCEFCGDSVSLYCEVLTVKRLADRVFGELGGLAEEVLDESGRMLAMRLAIRSVSEKLKSFGEQINKPEYLQNLVRLIDEFKTHGISCSQFAQTVEENNGLISGKLADLSLIYSAYDSVLGRNVKDPADLAARLIEKLEEGDYAVGKTVYIGGFTEFTPQELEIIRLFILKSNKVTAAFDFDPTLMNEDSADQIDSAFYGYVKSIERLRRIALSTGSPISEENLTEYDQSKGNPLAHLRRNLFRSDPAKYSSQCKAISLHAASDRWEEVEQAASEIIRLCRDENYRYKDIVVAFPDYNLYSGIVEAVFEAWNIPLFSDRMDEIIKKPAIAAIESAIDVILRNFSYNDVFRYLKTGLAGIPYEDCCRLENYVIAWNIRGRRWTSKEKWTMNPRGFSEPFDERAERELDRINEIRSRVMSPFVRLIERAPAGKVLPASEIITAFYDFLTEAGVDSEIRKKHRLYIERRELKLADEYAQLWGLVCDALDTCYTILGQTPMDFAEFAGIFKLLLGTLTVGTIPVSLDSVAVGDAGRMRHRNAKCVMLLGTCNGDFPPPVDKASILTDEEREELLSLGLSIEPPASMLLYRSLDIAYSILTLASDKLYISYPETTSGTARTLSYLAESIKDMFSLEINPPAGDERLACAEAPCFELAMRSAGISDSSVISKAAYRYFLQRPDYRDKISIAALTAKYGIGSLSPDSVRKLYGDKIVLTASRADKLHTCKFAYFMQYGLRAKPRLKAGLDAPEIGTFLHYVLEKTLDTVMQRGGPDDLSAEEIRSIAGTVADNYSVDVLGGMSDKTARVRFLFKRLKNTAIRVVENIIEELKASKFKPLALELSFGEGKQAPPVSVGEGEESIELVGVVDRVDGWEKDGKLYIRVVDYKSGYKKFDLSDIWHGLNLQMFLYLFALEKYGNELFGMDTVGAGVLYVPVKDAVYSGTRGLDDVTVRSKIDTALRRSGLILRNEEIVEAMEEGAKKRFIPVSISKKGLENAGSSSLANLEQLGRLKDHIDMLLRRMGKALREGSVQADPYYRGVRSDACMYCDFYVACRFDKTNGKDRMRYLYPLKPEEFWKRVGGNADGSQSND